MQVLKCCAAVAALALLAGCEKKEDPAPSIDEKDIKKISETLGHYVIENLNTQQLALDMDSFIKGMAEAKQGREPPLSKHEFSDLLAEYKKTTFKIKGSENLEIANDYLAANQHKPHMVAIEKGKLQYKILETGTGKTLTETDAPLIRYEARLINGQVFDSTEKRGRAIGLSLKSTIPGLRKGIAGMKEGEKRRLFIHPDLGYKEKGRLPPNSLLIFDIEIVEAEIPQHISLKPLAKDTDASWFKRWIKH